MENHISKEEFWLQFFGDFGRELGDPNAHFTENPLDIFQFIKDCTELKRPAFISVNPRIEHDKVLGIEKLFFDFDFGKKSENLTQEEIEERKYELIGEVMEFINDLTLMNLTPMIVKTNKGFHIYVFLANIFCPTDNLNILKEIYRSLQLKLIYERRPKIKYKYFDTSVLGDIKRLCRIPLSIHQKTGEECYLVKKIVKTNNGYDIIKDKIHGITYFKTFRDYQWAFKRAENNILAQQHRALIKKIEQKELWEDSHGFVGRIRPCFIKQLESKEMSHKQRLALEIEAFFSGKKTEDEIVDLFRNLNDFNEYTTREQVKWFFDNTVPKFNCGLRPYTCEKIMSCNWCIKKECERWVKKYGKQKPTKK